MRTTLSLSILTGLAAIAIVAFASGSAFAAPVPAPGVTINTFAQYGLATDPTAVGPEAGSSAFFSDQARALGAAGLPGGLQSLSQAGGAGGVSPVGANSTVNQVTNWTGTGVGAGTPIDLDLTITLDGFLRVADFAGTSAGSLLGTVSMLVDLTTESGGTQSLFSAGADLANGSGLSTTGDWTTGDFSCSGGSDQTCTLDFSVALADTVIVNAGEVFSIETQLATAAIVPGAFETITLADFFNTGAISLSSSTPGASFAFVPEPSTALMLGLGLLGLGVGRRS